MENQHADEITILCALAAVAFVAFVFLAMGRSGHLLLAVPMRWMNGTP